MISIIRERDSNSIKRDFISIYDLCSDYHKRLRNEYFTFGVLSYYINSRKGLGKIVDITYMYDGNFNFLNCDTTIDCGGR